MSLFGALFTGVSGMNAQARALGTISNNIANVNTVGYKKAGMLFSALVTGTGEAAVSTPGGVQSASRTTVGEQGLLQQTGSNTDLAVSGQGLFIVKQGLNAQQEPMFTRAGSFKEDQSGFLRNSAGFYLMGWPLDATGNRPASSANIDSLVPVNLAFSGGVTSPTTAGELSIQLNADAANGDQFSRTLRIYDSLGAAHDMNIQFTKTGVGAWDMEVFDDATPPVSLGVTALTFDGTGQLTAPLPPSVNVTTGAWPNGADPTIFDIDISGMTQYSGDFEVILAGQNGAALGQRSSVGVDERGFVTATFTNGQTRRLYQLPLATFPKVDGLELRTGNAYSQTRDSGEYILNIAGAGGTGRMSSQALEQSNVDLAEEFSRMIVTQRAYSASTKVITTSDQMLAELMNLR